MSCETHVESLRSLLWAMARLLERDDAAARASLFELRSLAAAGVRIADEALERHSPAEAAMP